MFESAASLQLAAFFLSFAGHRAVRTGNDDKWAAARPFLTRAMELVLLIKPSTLSGVFETRRCGVRLTHQFCMSKGVPVPGDHGGVDAGLECHAPQAGASMGVPGGDAELAQYIGFTTAACLRQVP